MAIWFVNKSNPYKTHVVDTLDKYGLTIKHMALDLGYNPKSMYNILSSGEPNPRTKANIDRYLADLKKGHGLKEVANDD